MTYPNQHCGECPVWLTAFDIPELDTIEKIIAECKSRNCFLVGRTREEIESFIKSKSKKKEEIEMPHKINNCPKCGADEWVVMLTCGNLPKDLGYYVICDHCEAKTKIFKKRNKAVLAWNGGKVNVV